MKADTPCHYNIHILYKLQGNGEKIYRIAALVIIMLCITTVRDCTKLTKDVIFITFP